MPPPKTPEPSLASDGYIDFRHGYCMYRAGNFWKLFANGRDFIGQPGAWEEVDRNPTLTTDDPFWLLTLLSATEEAIDLGDRYRKLFGGSELRVFRACANFLAATSRGPRSLAPPAVVTEADLARLPLTVWLDNLGRVRRALLSCQSHEINLELADFGGPAPLSVPRREEIIWYRGTDWDRTA